MSINKHQAEESKYVCQFQLAKSMINSHPNIKTVS